jgi:hypothetical protein
MPVENTVCGSVCIVLLRTNGGGGGRTHSAVYYKWFDEDLDGVITTKEFVYLYADLQVCNPSWMV